jgi:hypothetical protein
MRPRSARPLRFAAATVPAFRLPPAYTSACRSLEPGIPRLPEDVGGPRWFLLAPAPRAYPLPRETEATPRTFDYHVP